jgi:hypothetical protein
LLLFALQLGLSELLRFMLKAMREPAIVNAVSSLAPALVTPIRRLGGVFGVVMRNS